MSVGHNNLRGGGRRRSASESDGDVMSSTLNPVNPSVTNRISNINNDRCISSPHINISGFIDDSYRNNLGTRLETRTQTRSKGGSNSIDGRMRNEYTRIKISVFEWGEIATNTVQPLHIIDSKYNEYCTEIEQCISKILLARGDYALIGELGSIKDRLSVMRREARQFSRAHLQQDNRPTPDQSLQNPPAGYNTRNSNLDNVFVEPPINLNNSLSKTLPSSTSKERGGEGNLSRIDLHSGSQSIRTVMASSTEPLTEGAGLVRHSTPDDNVIGNPQTSAIGIDLSQSLTDILAGIPDVHTNPGVGLDVISTCTDSWFSMIRSHQIKQDERLESLHNTILSLNLTIQGAEAMYTRSMETLEDLKSNSDEVWRRLMKDENRLDRLDSEIERVETMVNDKMSIVQEWFADLTDRPISEVPREIVNSIQEIINDSAPGLAIDSMREEVRELRQTVTSSKHATEGLHNIVVDLSEQIANNSVLISPDSGFISPRDSRVVENNSRECGIVRKGIERLEKQIRQLTQDIMDTEPVDISLIKKCKTVDVPCVHAAVGNIQKALQKYVTFSEMDVGYCDYINDLLDTAENWCLKIEDLYNRAEIHSINTSKGDTADVGIFSVNAKVTVYEFLESAELAYLGWGNSVQKANRLYNRHLSEEIKGKLIDKSDSYSEMKKWLIQQYGGASRIINDIINDLSLRPKPNANDSNAKFTFYAYISGALQRLERLSKVNCIDKVELESCLCSRATLSSLSLVLPSKTYMKWISEMTRNNLDYKNPAGPAAYKVFKNLCIVERNTSEGSRIPEKPSSPKTKPRSPKPKPKSVYKIQEKNESCSDDELQPSTFATTFHNQQWYPPNLKFPCPIGNHKHEMSTCSEFFSLNPVERWGKMDKGKICYACLLPKNVCTDRKCSFEASIPETIKCHGCAPWAQSKNLAPFNILFCRNKDHSKLRAAFKDMKRDLEKYIGKLGTTVVDSSIKFAANYTFQVFSLNPSSANALGWDQENFKEKPAPSIDSETGKNVSVPESDIVLEIAEHSCYLMQTVRIGNSDALIFFDRGANIHIVDGTLAEREGLQRVSSNPTSLTVVGGNKVRSKHGTYRFNLGPGEKGEFHEIVCVGMDDVTAGFGSYDLSDICSEFREQAEDYEKDILLPGRVGGSKVHLLLGIKNTNLDPLLLKRLPSGVAVYLSPFKDVYGSRIIFAGPHKSFTEANKGIKNPMSNAVFFMKQKIEDELDQDIEERQFSILTNKFLGTTVCPHPITEEDVLDCNGGLSEQFENTLDDHDNLEEILDESYGMCSVHKAQIPIAKFRNAIDDEDKSDSLGFRCSECSKCITCKTSSRRTAISLQEAREQQFIEESVMIDVENNKVIVNYPFLRDPIEFLSARHHGPNNFSQAEKVYLSQCRKSDLVKEGMRKVHKDLVDKGFMVKLENLETGKQEVVKNAPFQHYNPWRLVLKSDSVSTPVRMVVDPSMTGFNFILAKGENRLGLIFTILIRCRCTEHIWSSDISKLYNQLIMDDPSLPYSLFLFHESLDPNVRPDIWVMVRAWYGIVSTGGQAGYALDKLTEMYGKEYPKAYQPLRENRYVDDLLSGDDTKEGREEQIKAVEQVLSRGGFSLKFVVRSGEKPSEKASADGETLKLLGYKWDSELDRLSPGVGELNMNKKQRGEKKPNPRPVKTVPDAVCLLASVKLTRSLVVGKISELFDPCGWFEPIKLQMKLQTMNLKGRGWEDVLPETEQVFWKDILKGYVNLPSINIPRFCIPSKEISKSKIRLICLSDAAEFAGGAAIYAGRELSPGNWSCSLLAAKSKMMSETIPRNELSAILLCTELAFMVKVALKDEIGEIIFATDSTIALSWCSNPNIKLRLFVYNRVMTILRLFEWTTGSKENPLFHIEGSINLADLLTKKHDIKIEDVSAGSDWIEGLEWMRREKSEMPLTSYMEIKLEKPLVDEIKVECFPEAFTEKFSSENKEADDNSDFVQSEDESEDDSEESTIPFCVLAANAGRGAAEQLLVDPVYHGWRRSLRIIGYMQAWAKLYKHETHLVEDKDCRICILSKSVWDPRNEEKYAQNYYFRWETERIKQCMKPAYLTKFVEREGILYDDGRLGAEFQFKTQDLDQVEYIDKHEIINQVPIVLNDSPVLYAYLMYVHTKTSIHAALEPTVKEIHKMMKVPKGLRNLIRRVISDCIKCKLISKKTLELKMANHPESRTVLAPCFHSCMMDICYGFKGQAYKRARTIIKVYGLVIVCLLSGATNIMALEGIETQDICTALERHSNRYGVPGYIYIDNGTQLKALQFATFSIRDIEAQVQDSLGIKIVVSNAKAHAERGRVERRIRVLRETLEKLGVQTSVPMTCMQWDALFSRISNTLDNLPLAKGDTSNVTALGYDIITPNRLKLGRNNYRSLEGCGIDLKMSSNFTRLLDRNRNIYRCWYQTFVDNIHLLNLCPNKWLRSGRLPIINDIVLFVFNDGAFSKDSVTWKLGRVSSLNTTSVCISYFTNVNKAEQTVTRSFRDISIVYSVGEMMINTLDHFNSHVQRVKSVEK